MSGRDTGEDIYACEKERMSRTRALSRAISINAARAENRAVKAERVASSFVEELSVLRVLIHISITGGNLTRGISRGEKRIH